MPTPMMLPMMRAIACVSPKVGVSPAGVGGSPVPPEPPAVRSVVTRSVIAAPPEVRMFVRRARSLWRTIRFGEIRVTEAGVASSEDMARSNAGVDRRSAGVAALVGIATSVIFVVAVLARNFGALVGGLVGLSIVSGGAWWVLTERMPRRAFGVVGIVVGALVMAVAFAVLVDGVDRIGLRVLGVGGVLAATLGCARAALRREVHQVQVRVRAAGPPRHAVLLCNPRSGGGKVDRFGLLEVAAQLGVETVVLEPGMDLEALARAAVARGS